MINSWPTEVFQPCVQQISHSYDWVQWPICLCYKRLFHRGKKKRCKVLFEELWHHQVANPMTPQIVLQILSRLFPKSPLIWLQICEMCYHVWYSQIHLSWSAFCLEILLHPGWLFFLRCMQYILFWLFYAFWHFSGIWQMQLEFHLVPYWIPSLWWLTVACLHQTPSRTPRNHCSPF